MDLRAYLVFAAWSKHSPAFADAQSLIGTKVANGAIQHHLIEAHATNNATDDSATAITTIHSGLPLPAKQKLERHLFFGIYGNPHSISRLAMVLKRPKSCRLDT